MASQGRDAALVVAEDNRIAGLVVLEDILKPGIRDRFERLRQMGLRTVMVTGDNPLTAKAIAAAGRRGRLHRPGHPRGQAGLHPQGAAAPASWWP